MWNTLPLEIREIRIPITFKFNLKQHLWKLVWEDITNSDIDSSLSKGILNKASFAPQEIQWVFFGTYFLLFRYFIQ